MTGEAGARSLDRFFEKHLGPAATDTALGASRKAFTEVGQLCMSGVRDQGPPIFSAQLRTSLRTGKYTRWADNLTEPDLARYLGLLADCRGGLPHLLSLADRHPVFDPWLDEMFVRSRVALDGLVRFLVRAERYDPEQARLHITGGIREWINALFRQIPRNMIDAAEQAAPGTAWRRFGRNEAGYLLGGDGTDGKWTVATISLDGRASIAKY